MECPFCYLWRADNCESLSSDVAKRLISQVASVGFEWFAFGGGDPLMRSDLVQLIRLAKKSGLKTDLQTNGLLLNHRLLAKLRGYIDRIGLSIDGYDEKTNDNIRGYPGHYRSVLAALRMCSQNRIPVVVRSVVCRQNINKLSRLGRVLLRYPCVEKWNLREFVPLGLGKVSKSRFHISQHVFLGEVDRIRFENAHVQDHLFISATTAEDMKNCYILISANGRFYTHPESGDYRSSGVFPSESVTDLLSKMGKKNLRFRPVIGRTVHTAIMRK